MSNNIISNSNNTNCRHRGVKSNDATPFVGRRSKHIKVYTNIHQKIHVKDKARQCGLSQSDYLLDLALGYEPKAILDGRQECLLESLIGARRDLILFSNALKGSTDALITVNKSVIELNASLSPVLTKVDQIITEIRTASESGISEQTAKKIRKISDDLTSVINEAIRTEGAKIVSNVKKQGKTVVARMTTTGDTIASNIIGSVNAAIDKLSESTNKTVTSFKTSLGGMETELSHHVDNEIHRMSKNNHRVSIPTWLFIIGFIVFAILCSLLALIFYENSQHWHYEQLILLYHTIVDYLTKAAIIVSLISTVGTIFLYLAKKFPYG